MVKQSPVISTSRFAEQWEGKGEGKGEENDATEGNTTGV